MTSLIWIKWKIIGLYLKFHFVETKIGGKGNLVYFLTPLWKVHEANLKGYFFEDCNSIKSM